jgi:hypothetical protein
VVAICRYRRIIISQKFALRGKKMHYKRLSVIAAAVSMLFLGHARAEEALKIKDVTALFLEAENPLCPGSVVKECRNPTCTPELPAKVISCTPPFGGGLGQFLGVACPKASPQAAVAAVSSKFGFDGIDPQSAVKDFNSLTCDYIRDPDPMEVTPDHCGTSDLDQCPYLGIDKCLVTFTLNGVCASEAYCGSKPAACKMVFNGVDEKAVAALGKLKPYEKVAISIFKLIARNYQAQTISADEGNAYLDKAVENLKNAKEDELLAIQEELISKLPT